MPHVQFALSSRFRPLLLANLRLLLCPAVSFRCVLAVLAANSSATRGLQFTSHDLLLLWMWTLMVPLRQAYLDPGPCAFNYKLTGTLLPNLS